MCLLSEDFCITFKKWTGKYSHGAKRAFLNANVHSCKEKCLQLATNCVAFELNHYMASCWVHDNTENIVEVGDDPNIDQYVKKTSSCACEL